MSPALAINKVDLLRDRASMLRKARDFFHQRGVVEVDTCALNRCAPIDSNIDVIEVSVSEQENGYLHTSPEYAMKRLLAAGMSDIYFLGHVYRKGELGFRHNPEFTMAEWYRLGITFSDLIQETCEFLFLFLGEKPTRTLSYRDAFAIYVGIDYIQAPLSQLQQLAREFLPSDTSSWTRDNYLHLLLTHLIEPHLGRGELTILTDYPPYEAALACVVEKNGEKVAERFEIYFEGIELTNSYHELGDAKILRARFEEENLERLSQGKKAYPLDEKFLSALEINFPECCGVSVGIDRALMLRHRLPSIHDILPFSWEE